MNLHIFSLIFWSSFLYGLFAWSMVAYIKNTSLLGLLLTIGYIMLFTALLQKFGGRSVKNGLRIGLISILGAALGWFIAVMLEGWRH